MPTVLSWYLTSQTDFICSRGHCTHYYHHFWFQIMHKGCWSEYALHFNFLLYRSSILFCLWITPFVNLSLTFSDRQARQAQNLNCKCFVELQLLFSMPYFIKLKCIILGRHKLSSNNASSHMLPNIYFLLKCCYNIPAPLQSNHESYSWETHWPKMKEIYIH